MKVGDLVKITRKSVGVEAGTIGLITKVESPTNNRLLYYSVQLCVPGGMRSRRHTRRYLRGDLRLI
jgi:hypothetical protein